MTKPQLIDKYRKAEKLRYTSPLKDWLATFPNAAALETFRLETGSLSWPGSYGESPWEDAFSIAYDLHHGISDSSYRFYQKNWKCDDSYYQGETLSKMQILAHFGQAQAIQFLKENLPNLIS